MKKKKSEWPPYRLPEKCMDAAQGNPWEALRLAVWATRKYMEENDEQVVCKVSDQHGSK